DQARAVLIDELTAFTNTGEPLSKASRPSTSFARQFAELTRDVAEEASSLASRIWSDIGGLRDAIYGGDFDLVRLIGRHAGLIGVIGTTFATLMILRLLRRPLSAHMTNLAARDGMLGAAFRLFGLVLVDILVVLLAFGCGYGLALSMFGEPGRVGVDQSLFLNGFLAVELAKAALRGGISPGSASLRFLPIGDRTARFAYRRASMITSIIGYGLLVAAPLAAIEISPAFGRAIAVLVMAAALILTLLGIWKLRSFLAEDAASTDAEADLTGRALAILDRIWPWLASVYALGVFAIAVSRPSAVLPSVIEATARSLLAVVAGAALVMLIGRIIKKGVPLPAGLRSDLPELGRRLDRLVPNFLKGLRLIVLIAVALMVIDAWQLIDVGGWLTSDSGDALLGTAASVAFVLAIAWLIWLAFTSWIEYRLSGSNRHMAGARERTLLSLFGNAATIAVAAIATMLVLSELGINIGPLLAGAGVLGLAIGFGAQKLVQDIITGVFIQFENAINTGDVVTVASITGVVEHLSIRSIGIRDVAGTYHLIPFSTIDSVANFNRGFAYHVADIGIAYKESVREAKEAMTTAFERVRAGDLGEHIRADLEMLGVDALGDSAVVVRARIRTAPGQQWAVGRAYNELVKEVFDERGIDIPFPHMTICLDTDKEGKTQLDGVLPAPT
ncbi:MAG: mechanosensitive ion channel domain-containing protein, partial [Geminicoccaceae bacterium]